MLYITVKSSAPASIRRSCAAKQAARNRRITRRMDAHKARTAVYTPAVIVPPVSPAVRVAAMLITDDITGRFARAAAGFAVRRVYPKGILTRTTDGAYTYVQPDGPAYLEQVDNGPAYHRPATPYTGSTAAACPVSYHPGIKLATPTASPAPLYKSSYSAQHAVQAAAVSPLLNLAGAVACNVVKRRYSDSAVSRFLTLQWDNVHDAARNNAAENIDDLTEEYTKAAAALDAAETLAKHDCKILGITGHVRARYIEENTAAEKAALQAVKSHITAAEKLDNTSISDFADIKSAAYLAGFELLEQYAHFMVKKGGTMSKNIDSEELINALIARNTAEKEDLTAARAAVEETKDAAHKAGYTRLMDFAPYREAKEKLAKYRRRNLIITMSSAARSFIGQEDHGGKVQAADIDAAARRAKDVTSAENAALYKAVDSAAKEDSYYTTARADIISAVQDAKGKIVIAAIIDGYTVEQVTAHLAKVYPSEKWYSRKVYRLFAAARADIANCDAFKDSVQCRTYLAYLTAAAAKE